MKHVCEIILNLDQWFRRRCRLKIFLFILQLYWVILFGRAKPVGNCGRGHCEEHFCEIISNLNH